MLLKCKYLEIIDLVKNAPPPIINKIIISLNNFAPKVLKTNPTPMQTKAIILILTFNFKYQGDISVLSQADKIIIYLPYLDFILMVLEHESSSNSSSFMTCNFSCFRSHSKI